MLWEVAANAHSYSAISDTSQCAEGQSPALAGTEDAQEAGHALSWTKAAPE